MSSHDQAAASNRRSGQEALKHARADYTEHANARFSTYTTEHVLKSPLQKYQRPSFRRRDRT